MGDFNFNFNFAWGYFLFFGGAGGVSSMNAHEQTRWEQQLQHARNGLHKQVVGAVK